MNPPYQGANRTFVWKAILLAALMLTSTLVGCLSTTRDSLLGYSGVDLQGRDFGDQDLRGEDFSNSNLKSANFSGADLTGANFRGANLEFARFDDALLDDADLRNAVFQETIFDDASFNGANFENTDLTGADLDRGNYTYANFAGATLPTPGRIDLSGFGGNLSYANFQGTDFGRSDLRGSNFSHAILDNADLSESYMSRIWGFPPRVMNFANASMVGTDLSDASLEGASFVYSDLTDANLAGAHVKGADFSHATMEGADLTTILEDVRGEDVNGCPLLYSYQEITYVCRGGHLLGPSMNLSFLHLQGLDLSDLVLLKSNLVHIDERRS